MSVGRLRPQTVAFGTRFPGLARLRARPVLAAGRLRPLPIGARLGWSCQGQKVYAFKTSGIFKNKKPVS